LTKNNIPATPIKKVHEGRPNIVDAIHNKEIDLIINTPIGKSSKYDDSYIRKTALKYKLPYITTTAAANAAAAGIRAYLKSKGDMDVQSLQEYHRDIR
jgi:carbamoyl-phosphate synthase large subunit